MTSDRPNPDESIEALLLGTPYRPVRTLGHGSMGQVWAIRHEFIDREFALKVLHQRHTTNRQLIERLKLEARAIAALQHPNIVEVTDFWVAADGRPCLVMELLCGQRLDRELLQRKRLAGPDVIEIGRQALSALRAAHAIGLIHRDVKPENIFLDRLPNHPPTVKLLDFGFARVVDGQPSSARLQPLDLTRTGTVFGSPRFTSPEALRGEKVSFQADLYSLGVVLYVCLVGLHNPFDIATMPVFHRPSQCGAIECPAALDAALLRALESDPRLRYASAADFLDQLNAIAI